MTDEEKDALINEVIQRINDNSQPVQALQAEKDIRAVSSIIAMSGDTLVRAPMSLITQLFDAASADEDKASRALSGATMPFNGFVEGVTTKDVGFAIWDAILFDNSRQTFLARSLLSYSTEWTTRTDYVDSDTGYPRTGKIFINPSGEAFFWNASTLQLESVRTSVAANLSFSFDAQDTEWIIRHNLNRIPAVTVIDREQREVICDISHTSSNELIIQFGRPVAGTAILT